LVRQLHYYGQNLNLQRPEVSHWQKATLIKGYEMPNANPTVTVLSTPAPNVAITNSEDYFSCYDRVLASLPHAKVEHVADTLHHAFESGRRVFIFGNGGSAALASHFACDLAKGTSMPEHSRKRFKVLSLTDNVPLVTAWANDTSYDQVFAEQLHNFVQPGDIAFAISGSGNSPNVLLGLQTAREAGAFNIGLGGFQGGKMKSLCDLCIVIPSDNMQIIEDLHVGVCHAVFTLVRHRIQMRNSGALSLAVGAS
jgi:D-sedoheptulose 7-phosphate isomerase